MFYHPRRPSDTEALHRVIKSATYMPAFAKSRRQLPRQHQSGPTSSSDHHGVLGHRHTRHVRKCGRSTPIATLAPSINACAIGTESAAGAASTGAFGVLTEDVDRETRPFLEQRARREGLDVDRYDLARFHWLAAPADCDMHQCTPNGVPKSSRAPENSFNLVRRSGQRHGFCLERIGRMSRA